ncbi:MAG: MATE family efflux transporter [Mogibacterium sp.]|nr:MATE family efflux transporter [Mogibacterium sp.]
MERRQGAGPGGPNTLGTEPVGQLLLRYAIPTIISTLIGSLYNIVDQIFIGHRVGYLGNAATTVAYPLTILCGALFILASNGSGIQFNLRNGKKDTEGAMRYAGNGIMMLVITGITLAILIGAFTPFFVYICGATEEVTPYAVTYLRITALGIPFLGLTQGGTLLVRSDGSPRYTMVCSLSGVAVNFVLDYLFLFPLGMGIAGAALATIFGQILSAALVIRYFFRFRTGRFRGADLRFTSERLRDIVSTGAAASLNQVAMLLMNLVLNNSLRYYGSLSVYGGSEALAAAGVVTKINFLFYATIVGCSIGGAPIIGFNYGAKQYDRVRKTYFLILRYAIVIGILETACFWLIPGPILSLFGNGASGYEAFALQYMHKFMLFVVLAGIPPISMNVMSGIGRAKKGIVISMSKQLTLVLLLLILPRLFGIDGILWSGPAADILAALCSLFVLRGEFRKMGEGGVEQQGEHESSREMPEAPESRQPRPS